MIQTLNYQTAKNMLLTFRYIENVSFLQDNEDYSINIYKTFNGRNCLIGYVKVTKRNSEILKKEFAEYFK